MKRLGAVIFALLISSAGYAEQRVVQANVVEVVPLTQVSHTCGLPKPTEPIGIAGLVALLEWDLQPACAATITGYRVYYTWDDRTYSRISKTRPDATLPILLTVD